MVSVLIFGEVDRGFEPLWGQTKDYEIGICCFSAKNADQALSNNHLAYNIKYPQSMYEIDL
jgi:hypothetical protein